MTSAGNLSLKMLKQLLGHLTGCHPVSLHLRYCSIAGKRPRSEHHWQTRLNESSATNTHRSSFQPHQRPFHWDSGASLLVYLRTGRSPLPHANLHIQLGLLSLSSG